MKKRNFLTLILLFFAMAASAQVQLLYMEGYGRNVIDRNKKLYWMDGDDDPCFVIKNYKKAGNKETFTLESKEMNMYGKPDIYQATIILDASGKEPVQITLNNKEYGKHTCKVTTTSGSEYEDKRVKDYFNGLAGNPVEPEVGVSANVSAPKSAADVKPEGGVTETTDKVKDTAKETFGKVKGLFKKKKK